MPCYTPEESNNEIESRNIAKLIIIFDKKTGLETPDIIKKYAEVYYENHCDYLTPLLCRRINSLSPDGLDCIVYNGKDAESRMLADWFDKHDTFDKNK